MPLLLLDPGPGLRIVDANRVHAAATMISTARVAGALLAEGHTQTVAIVLDNPSLTEAQVLKALSREKLPVGVVQAVSQHRKWSHMYNVRLALVRHRNATLSTILAVASAALWLRAVDWF